MEYKNKYQNWLNDTNIDAETKEELRSIKDEKKLRIDFIKT